jgi:hypothetical protein
MDHFIFAIKTDFEQRIVQQGGMKLVIGHQAQVPVFIIGLFKIQILERETYNNVAMQEDKLIMYAVQILHRGKV